MLVFVHKHRFHRKDAMYRREVLQRKQLYDFAFLASLRWVYFAMEVRDPCQEGAGGAAFLP
jgi:hypothetical protein